MDIIRNHSFAKFIRIYQEDLNEALKLYILKKPIIDRKEVKKWNIKFPILRTDAITMEYKIGED